MKKANAPQNANMNAKSNNGFRELEMPSLWGSWPTAMRKARTLVMIVPLPRIKGALRIVLVDLASPAQ
jgi:hypothetical protein